MRGKNRDFGQKLSGKILISFGSVVLVSEWLWPLSIRAIGIINMDMAGEQRPGAVIIIAGASRDSRLG